MCKHTYTHTYAHVLSAYICMYACVYGDEGTVMRCRQRRARQKQNKAGKQSIDMQKEQRAKSANRRQRERASGSVSETLTGTTVASPGSGGQLNASIRFSSLAHCTFSLREFVVGIRRACWEICARSVWYSAARKRLEQIFSGSACRSCGNRLRLANYEFFLWQQKHTFVQFASNWRGNQERVRKTQRERERTN